MPKGQHSIISVANYDAFFTLDIKEQIEIVTRAENITERAQGKGFGKSSIQGTTPSSSYLKMKKYLFFLCRNTSTLTL